MHAALIGSKTNLPTARHAYRQGKILTGSETHLPADRHAYRQSNALKLVHEGFDIADLKPPTNAH
jgi:hypothetical protein